MTQTPLSISRLKELTRKRKHAEAITHMAALEAVARDAGWRTWKEALGALSPPEDAPAPSAARHGPPEQLLAPVDELVPAPLWGAFQLEHPAIDFEANARLAELIALRRASTQPCAEVEWLPVAVSSTRKVFHRVRIGTHVWSLHLDSYRRNFHVAIQPHERRNGWSTSAYWGDCTSLAFMEDEHGHQAPHRLSWHLVKYGNQPTADLEALAEHDIVEAAFQFGLDAIAGPGGASPAHRGTFFASPAFASVSQAAALALAHGRPLVAGRPRAQPAAASSDYLGEWHLRALRSTGWAPSETTSTAVAAL